MFCSTNGSRFQGTYWNHAAIIDVSYSEVFLINCARDTQPSGTTLGIRTSPRVELSYNLELKPDDCREL